jgi:hypothetical protein
VAVGLTPARRRALQIVRDHPGVGPTPFASFMWPESKGHKTRSRRHATPAGGAVGAGIKMTAGVFLGRLGRDGLITPRHGDHGHTFWYLTEAGRKALDGMAADGGHSDA